MSRLEAVGVGQCRVMLAGLVLTVAVTGTVASFETCADKALIVREKIKAARVDFTCIVGAALVSGETECKIR